MIRKDGSAAVLANGVELPITNWFDAEGDETDNREDARVFVCGAVGVGWFVGVFDDYESIAGRFH